jgi:hypothetical protein
MKGKGPDATMMSPTLLARIWPALIGECASTCQQWGQYPKIRFDCSCICKLALMSFAMQVARLPLV